MPTIVDFLAIVQKALATLATCLTTNRSDDTSLSI